MFKIQPRDRKYDAHRPKPCTVLTIAVDQWPGNEFGLWLPEVIDLNGAAPFANWRGDAHQEWTRDADGTWRWVHQSPSLTFQSTLTTDAANACLWYRHAFTNRSEAPLTNLNTATCFHLVNAPQFISIHAERIWACLDGRWATTDRVPRHESPDPRRVAFLRAGLRKERTVVPNKGFPSALMAEAAHHPLLIAEAFGGKASIGIAARNFERLFNNNDCILRCLHSEPMPIQSLDPGKTAAQEGAILFARGDHVALLEQFDRATKERWA